MTQTATRSTTDIRHCAMARILEMLQIPNGDLPTVQAGLYIANCLFSMPYNYRIYACKGVHSDVNAESYESVIALASVPDREHISSFKSYAEHVDFLTRTGQFARDSFGEEKSHLFIRGLAVYFFLRTHSRMDHKLACDTMPPFYPWNQISIAENAAHLQRLFDEKEAIRRPEAAEEETA